MININNKEVSSITIGGKEVALITIGGKTAYEKSPTPPAPTVDYFYIENIYNGDNTITVTSTETGTPTSGHYATSVEYSKDGSTWTTMNFDTTTPPTISMSAGEKVYFRNDTGYFNFSSLNDDYRTTFTCSQANNVGGDIRTLLDYTDTSNVSLNDGCFGSLFRGNTGLVDASDLILPYHTAYRCYYSMFYGCTSLTDSPALPSNTLSTECYRNMFRGCTSIVTATTLPNTTLAEGCYQQMFYGCTSLTVPPVLMSATLAQRCYSSMFNGCSSLDNITTYANDISASNCINNWLGGVAQTGTFYNEGSATYTTDSASGIPNGWTEVKPTPPTPTVDYFYVQNEYNGNNKITITTTKYDAHDEDPDAEPLDMTKCGTSIEWSKDLTTWNTETLSDQTPVEINMSQGETVYFRNETGKLNYIDYNWLSEWRSSIYCDHSFSVGGDIYTLIDYTGTNIGNRYDGCFHSLFTGSALLVDVTDLDFSENSLVPYEFNNTFFSTRFTTPPALPATTLASNCYDNMFASSAITSAPSLPATTLASYCYNYMFNYCSSLTTPPALPATTLADGCYHGMFSGSAITSAPSLQVTDLTGCYDCYSEMFYDCGSLTTPPALPATTLEAGCYSGMFRNSAITSAPILPATTLYNYCYAEMFAGCSSLNSVTIYADDISADDCLLDWLDGVANSGTFHNLGSAQYPIDSTSGIPTGWTEDNS